MITAIIQARTGSSRLPGKVFADLSGQPLIWHVVNRLKYSKKIERIVLATTVNPKDDVLEQWAQDNKIDCFRGSENNVLERYYMAAKAYEADVIVRITADDPFKDPVVIDSVIEKLQTEQLDFSFNNNPPSFPEGLDVEVFTMKALETAYRNSTDPYEQEHVTQYFYRNKPMFKQGNFAYEDDISALRWTIDTDKDLEMAAIVYEKLYQPGKIFFFGDILDLFEKQPEISNINSHVEKSAMYKK